MRRNSRSLEAMCWRSCLPKRATEMKEMLVTRRKILRKRSQFKTLVRDSFICRGVRPGVDMV